MWKTARDAAKAHNAVMTLRGPIITIAIRCHYCGQDRHPDDIMTIGNDIKMCLACRESHVAEIIRFHPQRECAVCHRTFDELKAMQLGDHFSVFVHWIDRSYQILCPLCDEEYVKKRADLYGDTEFGYARKLK